MILRRLESGETAEAVCRSVNISEATLYRWKQQYGALELSEVKELKALREENARLRRVVADQVLNIQVLKEVNAKNGEPVAEAPRCPRRGRGGPLFPASGVPLPWTGSPVVRVPPPAADGAPGTDGGGHPGALLSLPTLWLPADPRLGRAAGPPLCAAHGAARSAAGGITGGGSE